MEQSITLLCDIDPMLDDVKILARCVSIWKSHPAGKPHEVWSLDMVLQDEQVTLYIHFQILYICYEYNPLQKHLNLLYGLHLNDI